MARRRLEDVINEIQEREHEEDNGHDMIGYNDYVSQATKKKLAIAIVKCKQARRELGV